MRVGITGGAGYIGTHVAAECLWAGHEVLIVDNFSTSVETNLRQVRAATRRDFAISHTDTRDRAALHKDFAAFRPDVVVHVAGLKDAAESVRIPNAYFDTNVRGTEAVLSAMDKCGCVALVFSSSAAVYGEPERLPIDETHPCHPLTPYGESKLEAERLIADWTMADTLRRAVSLRYFNPAGFHPSGCIRPDQATPLTGLIPRIQGVARGRADCLDVLGNDYDTPDGTGLRDYLHVVDLARAHIAALAWLRDASSFEVFNVGAGRGVSVLELVRAYRTETGCAVPLRIQPRRVGDVARSWTCTRKAARELNWQVRATLQDIIASLHEETRSPSLYPAPGSQTSNWADARQVI